MGFTNEGEYSKRFVVRGYKEENEYANRYAVRGYLGYFGDIETPVSKDKMAGAMVYFSKPDVSGTFMVKSFNASTGETILIPHHKDDDDVLEELQDGQLTASKTSDGNILVDLGFTPGVYLKYWDAEFDGQQQVEYSSKDKEDIEWIQEFLQENGYLENYQIGVWTSATATAMSEFQKSMEISQTSVFDQSTASLVCKGLVQKEGGTRTQPAKKRVSETTRKDLKKRTEEKTQAKKTKNYMIYGGIAVLGLALAGTGYYLWKKKKEEEEGNLYQYSYTY